MKVSKNSKYKKMFKIDLEKKNCELGVYVCVHALYKDNPELEPSTPYVPPLEIIS